MILHVEFEHFAAAVKRHMKTPHAYVSRLESKTHVSAADPLANVLVSASTSLGMEEAQQKLVASGLETSHGGWAEGGHGPSDSLGELPFVVAVGYKSGDEMPGVWLDAYAEVPTPAIVLKSIYDEFRQTGEIGDLAFEEFVRIASPNVVIVSPPEMERFLADKRECD